LGYGCNFNTEAFSITPAVEGTITFEDSQRILRFKPKLPLKKQRSTPSNWQRLLNIQTI
jgi:hypothetical protein